jgi:hypothetical protein
MRKEEKKREHDELVPLKERYGGIPRAYQEKRRQEARMKT